MSAQRDLVVCEPPLGVHVAQRAHAVDDEAILFDRGLEALQAVPWAKSDTIHKSNSQPAHIQVIL